MAVWSFAIALWPGKLTSHLIRVRLANVALPFSGIPSICKEYVGGGMRVDVRIGNAIN